VASPRISLDFRLVASTGASVFFALSCLGGGTLGFACVLPVSAMGVTLALLGRGVEGAAVSFIPAMAWKLLGFPGATWPLLAGSALLVAASLERGARLALKRLLVLAGLATYTITYITLLYIEIPKAVDLSLYTLTEFSSPAARTGLALLGGVYGALLAYGIARPQRSVPRLLGVGGVIDYLRRRHKTLPLWLPLFYLLSAEPFLYMIIGLLTLVAATILTYTRTESLDLSLIASYAAVGIVLWLTGAPIP
jgi:hypothetical protein